MLGIVKKFRFQEANPGKLESSRPLVDFVVGNSVILVRARMVMFEGKLRDIVQKSDEDQELNPYLRLFIENSKIDGRSNGFLSEANQVFQSFYFNSQVKLSPSNLKTLRIQIGEGASSFLDDTLNVLDFLESIEFINLLKIPLKLKVYDEEIEASLYLEMMFFPRNLENAHILMNDTLITENMEKFPELIRDSEQFTKTLQQTTDFCYEKIEREDIHLLRQKFLTKAYTSEEQLYYSSNSKQAFDFFKRNMEIIFITEIFE